MMIRNLTIIEKGIVYTYTIF